MNTPPSPSTHTVGQVRYAWHKGHIGVKGDGNIPGIGSLSSQNHLPRRGALCVCFNVSNGACSQASEGSLATKNEWRGPRKNVAVGHGMGSDGGQRNSFFFFPQKFLDSIPCARIYCFRRFRSWNSPSSLREQEKIHDIGAQHHRSGTQALSEVLLGKAEFCCLVPLG